MVGMLVVCIRRLRRKEGRVIQDKRWNMIETIVKSFLYVVLIAFAGFVVAVVLYSLRDEKTGPLTSSETQFFQQLTGEYRFDLGPIEKDYMVCYRQLIREGNAETWIENEVGEEMPIRKNLNDYWMIAREAGVYYLCIDAEEAMIDITVSIYYPHRNVSDK